MNPKRLTKKLRRELTTNPKKAVVLGLLLLVAMYFWAPLLWGWVAGAGDPATTAQATPKDRTPGLGEFPSMLAAAASPREAGDNQKQAPKHPWARLARWIEQDATMAPAAELASVRDPFAPVHDEVDESLPNEEVEVAKAAEEVTPGNLGLVLSSTLIGPRRRTAVIDGRSYRQGQSVALDRDGRKIEFTLAEVHPRRIVLRRDDKQYDLKIPQSAPSGRLEMFGSAN